MISNEKTHDVARDSEFEEPPVSEIYRELFHYTDWKGFEGIWRSGILRATDYRYLNDFKEVVFIREHLIESVSKDLVARLREKMKGNADLRKRIRKAGKLPILAKTEATNVVNTAYRVTYQGSDNNPPFVRAFIASFCSHLRNEEPYEHRNGLLSQWRAYGKSERYAIVFDTKKLEKLLSEESSHYIYNPSHLSDVDYDLGGKESIRWISNLTNHMSEFVMSYTFDDKKINLAPLLTSFLKATTRLKHQGFREEKEKRIVGNPYTKELDAYIRKSAEPSYEAPSKPFKDIVKDRETGREYIELFAFNGGRRLPIRRVIVGPSMNQSEYARKAKALVKGEVRVHLSETPFSG